MDKFRDIITHEKAPSYAVLTLSIVCGAIAVGVPAEVGGIFTILGLAFLMFRKALKD